MSDYVGGSMNYYNLGLFYHISLAILMIAMVLLLIYKSYTSKNTFSKWNVCFLVPLFAILYAMYFTANKYIGEEVNAFIGDFFVPPEEMWYPEGENGAMVLERVMPVIKEWIESGKKNIAVVTHGGVIRTLLCTLFGGDFARRLMFGTSLENCSITQLHYDEAKNGFFLDRFNDYAHIEAEPGLLRENFARET